MVIFFFAHRIVCSCKKEVVAEKRFTIHDSPPVLTIHLKRFSPLGRKIGHPIHYDERLLLQPVMSEGRHGPSYSLYGVICHAGGGPNSGHYFAHVKAANGRWYEMNDDMVSPHHGAPVGMKNAYILFYLRDRGQSLEGAIGRSTKVFGSPKSTIIGGMKKRKSVELDEEDIGVNVSSPFIGPLLPSPMPVDDEQSPPKTPASDPQAVSLQKKITAITTTKPSTALSSLAQYDDEDSVDSSLDSAQPKTATSLESSPPPPPSTDSPQSPSSDHTSIAQIPVTSSDIHTPHSSGVDPGSFYASRTKNEKKRKSLFGDEDDNKFDAKRHAASPAQTSSKYTPHGQHRKPSFGGGALNPYTRLSGSNTLWSSDFRRRQKQYGNKRKRIII